MIIKITLILLYLVLGLWLYVAAVSELGGIRNIPAYKNRLVLALSLLFTVIIWPYWLIQGIINRRK